MFDAAKEKPHYESDETSSQSDYGNYKITCEQMLQNKLKEKCVIVRIPRIYGKNCPRILKLAEDIQNNTPIITYPDLYMNYTTDLQMAEWIDTIIKEDLNGIFHIGTKDVYNYMQFQTELIRAMGLNEPVFQKEVSGRKCFQAVLPGRMEIPEKLQMGVADILEYLKSVHK